MQTKIRSFLCILTAILLLPFSGALAANQLETDAQATVSGTQGTGSWYTGPVSLAAPSGFSISADGSDGSFTDVISVTPSAEGVQYLTYYLMDGTGAVSGKKYAAVSYDGTSPVPALYAPSVNAALSANQKLIFAFPEPVSPNGDKLVRVTLGDKTYTASASAAELPADKSDGPWYAVFSLSAMMDATASAETAGPLALSPASTYSVTLDEGAFNDRAGRPSAACTGQFVTTDDTSLLALVYLAGGTSGWSVVNAADNASIPCGAGVAPGTVVSVTAPSLSGRTVTASAADLASGAAQSGTDLSNLTVNGDTIINASVTKQSLDGSVTLSGQAVIGGTLTATAVLEGDASSSELVYTWKKDAQILASGPDAASFSPRAADAGAVLTCEVTSTVLSGTLSASSAPIQGIAPAAPAAPTLAGATANSITLNAVDKCEYRMDGGAWQDSPAFTGLEGGKSYTFIQRYKADGSVPASAESASLTAATIGALTGSISVSGTLQAGQTLTAGLTGSNQTGTVTYTWKRGQTVLATGASYQLVAEDAGNPITVEAVSSVQTGTLTYTTGAVQKAGSTAAAPAAPSAVSITGTSVTLAAVSGCEYSNGGTVWQDSNVFSGLAAGTVYTFYQRVKETVSTGPSPMSAGATITTIPVLTGTVTVEGEVRYGKTLIAQLVNSNNTGSLTYVWKRNGTPAATGPNYEVIAADIGSAITVEVTSSAQTGAVTRSVGTASMAEYIGNTPSAPTKKSVTANVVTLNTVKGYEYSKNGTSWQSSSVFSGLSAGRSYTFYQRMAATATMEASPASAGLKVTTSGASSSSGGSSGSSSGGSSSSGSTQTSGDTGGDATQGSSTGSGSLNNLTLTTGSTSVSLSDMQSLIQGNKTQDVTIQAGGVSYFFGKGTMALPTGKTAYDFGASIDNCVHKDLAKQLTGDAYVAVVHFNYSGDLPAKTTIRMFIGTNYAGQTLYYYKLDTVNKVLTFLQAANVDSSGYVSVIQSSCSDYVLLNRQYDASLAVTPTPSVSPTATPAVTAAVSPGAVNTSGGWLIILIIIAALALIAAGIAMFLKSRQRAQEEDEEDGFDFEEFDPFLDDGQEDAPIDGFLDEDDPPAPPYRSRQPEESAYMPPERTAYRYEPFQPPQQQPGPTRPTQPYQQPAQETRPRQTPAAPRETVLPQSVRPSPRPAPEEPQDDGSFDANFWEDPGDSGDKPR